MSPFQQGINQSALLLEEVFCLFCDMEDHTIDLPRENQERFSTFLNMVINFILVFSLILLLA